MKISQKILFCLAMMILASCATPRTEERFKAILNSRLGHPISDVVAQIGEPNKKYAVTNGLTAYEYNGYHVETQGGGYTPQVVQVGEQPVPHNGQIIGIAPIYQTIYHKNPTYDVEYFCDFIFEVDNQGIIQGWRYEGNDCVSNQPL